MSSDSYDWEAKQVERLQLAAQIQAFLSAGGRIQQIGPSRTAAADTADKKHTRKNISYGRQGSSRAAHGISVHAN